MATEIQSLARRLEAKGPAPVNLVQGPERLLVDEAVRLIVGAAVGDPHDAMSVTKIDMAEAGRGAKDVVAACRSTGLFTSKQAVVVRAAEVLDKKVGERDELAAYAAAPDGATTLVLVATKLNGTTALVRRIKKNGEVLSFAGLKAYQIPGWLVGEARAMDHRLDMVAARTIADLVGTSLLQLRLVLDQLGLYVGEGRPITDAAIEALLIATRAHGVFELVDAVGEKRLVPALVHLHAMMSQREPALRILAMLIRHFRLLWQVAEGRARGVSPADLRTQLGLHEFVVKKLWEQSSRFHSAALRRAYDSLYEADVRLKSRGHQGELVMERLITKLCGSRPARR